jgi:Xaa-Pro aminopeptidase
MTLKKTQLLNSSEINANYERIQKWMIEHKKTAYVVTSFDLFFSEYVPFEECHRYLLSGFSGSVGLYLMLSKGKSRVYVDGRYHEQADKEVNLSMIDVIKVPFGQSLENALLDDLKKLSITQVWVEEDRTPHNFVTNLSTVAKVDFIPEGKIKELIAAQGWQVTDRVLTIANRWSGKSVEEKLNQALADGEVQFSVALDQIAWLLNWRGNQMPCQQTFMSKVFATKRKIHLFIDQKIEMPVSRDALIEVHQIEWSNWRNSFEKFLSQLPVSEVKTVWIDSAQIGEGDFLSLKRVFSERIKNRPNGFNFLMNVKTQAELESFAQSFDRADRAIFASLNWLIKEAANHPTEYDFAEETWKNYQSQGARDLSFKTISGFGANSSIIHYSIPNPKVKLQKGELALLDSGGLFEHGMATDCTRTILPWGEPTAQQKELYTLVLKGLLSVMGATFPSGTPGSYLDALARFPIRQGGYEYAHGTGHGVGVNVHEAGYSLNPTSQVPLLANRVGSVEPGIYLPGVGGVRLENIMVVEKVSEADQNRLRLRSLVYVGFFWPLIDLDRLTKEEMQTFLQYEKECFLRGRSFAPKGTF